METRYRYSFNTLLSAAVMVAGLIAAIFLGQRVAQGDYRLIAMVGALIAVMVIALTLGKRYWLLIPLSMSASGGLGLIGLPFSYAEMGAFGAIGLFLVYAVFKRQKIGFQRSWIDLVLYLNLGYLATVYIRNPVGSIFFGGDMVGGKPYFTISLYAVLYFVLSNNRVGPRMAKFFPIIIAGPMMLLGAVSAASEYSPTMARIVYPFYTGVSIDSMADNFSEKTDDLRITSLAAVSRPLILTLCSYYRPISLLLPNNPLIFSLFLIGLLLTGLSGFRIQIATATAYMAISSFVRRKIADIVILITGGVATIIIISTLFLTGIEIPFAIQRALSFLPVGWSQAATADAQGTIDWRVDMWKDAWNSPNIIKNKLLGDGFGFSRIEMQLISNQMLGGEGILNAPTYEAHLIRGSFHSGPLSAVRFSGIIGLILLTIFMILVAIKSFKVARVTESSPYKYFALFLAIPLIWEPFQYYFLHGGYDTTLLMLIYNVGLMNMLESSHREWKRSQLKSATDSTEGTPSAPNRTPIRGSATFPRSSSKPSI